MNMGKGFYRGVAWSLGMVAALWMARGVVAESEVGESRTGSKLPVAPIQAVVPIRAVAAIHQETSSKRVPGTTTQPTTQEGALGPDVVMLKELVNLYEPVPFEHRLHAKMAEMWDGCVTCHHRNPEATTQPAGSLNGHVKTQGAAASVPACKSCHEVSGKDAEIHMPNLKGAYHRQCLNCHQEWMRGNHCVTCHKPRNGLEASGADPTRDDIVGRMHPPIPEPEVKQYKTRFTPADGGNVLFRHKEHTRAFGMKCVTCHRKDTCAHCHDPKADTAVYKPVRPGRTWSDSHGPCMSCHQEDRCAHCHYKDDQAAPKLFEHSMTGQMLDKDHVGLACDQCHARLKYKADPTCGDSTCHEAEKGIAFPERRPGTGAARRPTTRAASTQPATRPASGRAVMKGTQG